MKSLFILLVLCTPLVLSGQQKPIKPQSLERFQMRPLDKISLDTAAFLVSNILQSTLLNKLATTYSLGGTFPAKYLNVSSGNSGIIFWFCFKGGKNPELFLALEQLKSYDTSNVPQGPTSATLVRSTQLFKGVNGAANDQSSIKSYLQSHSLTNNASQPISNAMVTKYIASFDSLLATMRDASGQVFNKYHFSYFTENAKLDFAAFRAQLGPNDFVRYYFGYEEPIAPKKLPNRIRVILVGVDASGKNITSASTKGQDAVILQKSFPPPPSN